jgi:5-methyltetrahydrofolate--homocysteine methyltransferase
VASKLISETARDAFVADVANDYGDIRARRKGREKADKLITLEEARANAFPIDWKEYDPPRPSFLGTKTFSDYDLAELTQRIDWTPFFRTWELAGNYPNILDDRVVGETARQLFEDAQSMLQRIIGEGWLKARAVIGFWPANSVGDDVVLYADEARSRQVSTIHFLRQQMSKREARYNMCLADFIAPAESGKADYVGGFAVTAGIGIEEKLAEFQSTHDDYSDILLKALADRLAEAFAERMHERVRREFWAYAGDEDLSNEEIIKEKYRGIRPAPGYPACPDHTEKPELFRLLNAREEAGIELTESMAMMPASSVSGYYFAHPKSQYFGLGKIGRDQVRDYAERKGEPVEAIEKWLAPNLGY